MTPAPQRREGWELLLTSKWIFLDKLGVTEACHFDSALPITDQSKEKVRLQEYDLR